MPSLAERRKQEPQGPGMSYRMGCVPMVLCQKKRSLTGTVVNLQRLHFQTDPAASILSLMETKGLDASCQALRLKLLMWIRSHGAEEVVPDVTISDWVEMDGYSSLSHYIEQMKLEKAWIDTPMLLAASAVFELQLLVFLDDGRPHLPASQQMQKKNSAQVCLLANTLNVHFFAVRPVPRDNLEPCKTSSDMVCQHLPDPDRADSESLSDASDTELTPVIPDQDVTFRLCCALIKWDPWGPSLDSEIPDLLSRLEGTDEPFEGISQTLQWRAALKLLQHEQLEDSRDIDRSYQLELARVNILKRTCPANQKMVYAKSRALGAKLTLSTIKKYLDCALPEARCRAQLFRCFQDLPQAGFEMEKDVVQPAQS